MSQCKWALSLGELEGTSAKYGEHAIIKVYVEPISKRIC